jgi:hypothetical protein
VKLVRFLLVMRSEFACQAASRFAPTWAQRAARLTPLRVHEEICQHDHKSPTRKAARLRLSTATHRLAPRRCICSQDDAHGGSGRGQRRESHPGVVVNRAPETGVKRRNWPRRRFERPFTWALDRSLGRACRALFPKPQGRTRPADLAGGLHRQRSGRSNMDQRIQRDRSASALPLRSPRQWRPWLATAVPRLPVERTL